ncbi:T-cell-interacting, activating receptor on myeloid cells protein 1 isoform X2 [Choloepus didactylus]|uniref:T-cell-interacting, activating receptor on myeloid cells protein 1 isoform X2 n=1 Tax=Choloepus didactylus TaxID=27675 RepID=UPI0018A0C0AE|nr:T-cell-interacting, activating receptor on myeloid cells protein 1 isoform X2 [Choloepus didactylus]
MIKELLSLLCIGLCAGQGDRRGVLLPKPFLSAWPSTVVPPQSKVTLRCLSSINDVSFSLRRGEILLESLLPSHSTESWTKFPLSDLQQHDTGEYTCEYYFKGAPFIRSEPSNALVLVVTGALPKPSLQSHQKGKVAAGEDVTLWCEKPFNSTEFMIFALMRAGHPTPIQLQGAEESTGEFLLQTMTVSDTGNYSCVYYQANTSFLASHPSDWLEILVTDPCEGCSTFSPETDQAEVTKSPRTAEPTGIILIVIFILVILLSFAFICKYSPCEAASDKTARSSNSSKGPEEAVSDTPTAIKSGSPA